MSPILLVDGQEFAIEQDTWEAWKRLAAPFTDTPDAVLRRQFGLDPARTRDAPEVRATGRSPRKRPVQSPGSSRRTRVASHEILPEHEYYLPILSALARAGGSCESRLVVDEVGRQLDGRLTSVDRQDLPNNGGARWRSRVQFARLRLVKDGLLRSDSPRGIWSVSDQGLRYLHQRDPR